MPDAKRHLQPRYSLVKNSWVSACIYDRHQCIMCRLQESPTSRTAVAVVARRPFPSRWERERPWYGWIDGCACAAAAAKSDKEAVIPELPLLSPSVCEVPQTFEAAFRVGNLPWRVTVYCVFIDENIILELQKPKILITRIFKWHFAHFFNIDSKSLQLKTSFRSELYYL